MSRQIIIGDIHGCLKTFEALLDKIELQKKDQLFLLGDYVDRGPDSKGVVDKVIDLQESEYSVVALRGNHEQMLLNNYIAETERGWYNMGDQELLESFRIDTVSQIPVEYIRFFDSLSFYHEEEEFILVHAGLSFAQEDPFSNTEALLWARDWYNNIDKKWLGSRIIVHGHTMQSKEDTKFQFQEMKINQYLNIDCGAVVSQSKKYGLGYLCAFDFTNKQLIFQENVEPHNNF